MNAQSTIRLAVCLLGICCALSAEGQSQSIKRSLPIEVITKQTESSILLRWAFDTPSNWYLNKNISFDLYRADLADGHNKTYLPIAQDITVASKVSLDAQFAQDQSNIGIGAILQAYYGAWQSQGEGNDQFGILDKKDELESKYMILLYACDIDWETAELAGLGYEDSTADMTKDYIYRFVPSDTSFLVQHFIAQKNESPVLKISETSENENQIVLGWSRHLYENAYTGFYIEKSKDGIAYERLNHVPYVHLQSEDYDELPSIVWQENVINYQPAYYRIVGIDAFGQESQPSDPVRLQGRDRTPPPIPQSSVTLSADQSHASISWAPNIENDISEFVIRKADNADGRYREIARVPKTVIKIEDTDVDLVHQSYYQVCAVDTAQNYGCSPPLYLVLDDKIAPAAPMNLTGQIDTNGVVTLIWDKGPETDLWGYYVQVSNATGRVFTSVTPRVLQANLWKDTIPLDVLTEHIYYRVNAVDLRSNTSDFSEIIQLKKPDIVPPNASLFSRFEVLDSSVQIAIVRSSSRDVNRVTLLRSTDGKSFSNIADISKGQTEYYDYDVQSATQYMYRLHTFDDAGNSTTSPSDLIITTRDMQSDHTVQLRSERRDGAAVLTWDALPSPPQYIKLYQARGNDLNTIQTLKSTVKSVTLEITKNDAYRIRVFYPNGTKSAYSNVVNVSSD